MTIAVSMLKKPIGCLLWVFFIIFLTFSLYVGKEMSYRKAVENALKKALTCKRGK
jgi:hypothetical protein